MPTTGPSPRPRVLPPTDALRNWRPPQYVPSCHRHCHPSPLPSQALRDIPVITEKGVAQHVEHWDIREGAVEET